MRIFYTSSYGAEKQSLIGTGVLGCTKIGISKEDFVSNIALYVNNSPTTKIVGIAITIGSKI